MIDRIRESFRTHKIHQLQLDPFGFCNAKCWFCPVKYRGNPSHAKGPMSVELLEKIITNLMKERERDDGLVHKHFGGFYTAHYNEILLYKNLERLLQLCQEHRLCFMVLSNGVPMTKEKVDLIKRYPGVVNGICLNIPAFEKELWAKRAGMQERQFDLLIQNVHYAMEQFPNMVTNKSMSIQVNGANEFSWADKGGWLTKGPEFPDDMDLDHRTGELETQTQLAKSMFQGLQVFSVPSLIDRAGSLDHIMTNKEAIVKFLRKGDDAKEVTMCGNGREVGGRPVGWLHVNAIGQAFLCCNDYDMEVVIGDFNTQELRDFWGTEDHIHKVAESYRTICRSCASALYD